jgi:hypothetical protein
MMPRKAAVRLANIIPCSIGCSYRSFSSSALAKFAGPHSGVKNLIVTFNSAYKTEHEWNSRVVTTDVR